MSANEITLTTIYEILKVHTARFDAVDRRVDGLDAHLDRFEAVQNARAPLDFGREHRQGTQRHASNDAIPVARTRRIEQEYVMITEALRRLEQRYDKLESDRLNERIAALEARVHALETSQA